MAILKAVLLDLDGLLLDTEPLHFAAWSELSEEEGFVLHEDDYARFVGVSDRALAEYIAAQTKTRASVIELIARKTGRYLQLMRTVRPMPGVKDLLLRLRKNHLRLGVVSNSPRVEVMQGLQFAGIFSFFDTIISIDDVPNPKPAPDMYLRGLRRLKVHARECVAFEDSQSGMLAAKAAGIYCIAVPSAMGGNQSFVRADLVVKSIPSLLGQDFPTLRTRSPLLGKLLGAP